MRCFLLSLVLQFDGSIRQPHDLGFPSAGLGRMASGGAAILSNDETLVALGGKLFGSVHGMTSAHAEYEGLLLGLRWLVSQSDDWWDPQSWEERQITIQGDCRTVIDQLMGFSVPRKLRQKHEEAAQLMDSLSERTGSGVCCQHILRDKNSICDSVCRGAIETLQLKAMNDVYDAILESAKLPLNASTKPRKAQSSPLTDALIAHIHGNSLVKYSMRPLLYREASIIAHSLGDAIAIKMIGEWMVKEAKLWPSINQPDAGSREYRELLITEGVKLQIHGLRAMGLDKEASRVERKQRFILGKFGKNEALFENSVGAQQSFTDIAHTAYQNHLNTLAQDGLGPLLSSWHTLAFQTIFERQANQSVDQDIWIEETIVDPVNVYKCYSLVPHQVMKNRNVSQLSQSGCRVSCPSHHAGISESEPELD